MVSRKLSRISIMVVAIISIFYIISGILHKPELIASGTIFLLVDVVTGIANKYFNYFEDKRKNQQESIDFA